MGVGHVNHLGICDERHRRIATEAGLLGGLVAKDIHPRISVRPCGLTE
jgi:hypothetical protein